MIVTHKISMDLTRRGTVCIEAVQDDRYCRDIQIRLFANSQPFTPPADCSAEIRFSKSDGRSGRYDTMPDGSDAWSLSGNTLTVRLAPQVLTAAGEVSLSVALHHQERELSCFPLRILVLSRPELTGQSADYVNVTRFLPQPTSAEQGLYLCVDQVDDRGRVTAVSAVQAPTGSGGTSAVTSVNGKTGAVTLTIPTVPSVLPNPQKLTLTGAVSASYDGSAAVSVAIPKVDTVPEYVTAEAARLAAVVQSRQNANTISFIACSDLHYSTIYNADRQKAAMTHMGQAMALLRKAVHIDFAAMLGDMIWDYGEDSQTAQAEVRFVNECLAEGFAGIPNFRTRGNHENGHESGANLTDAQIFSNVGAFNSGAVYGNRLAGYCYRDFPDVCLRVICLNSSEGGGCQFSAQQVAWLGAALQMPSGWRSIILSHHPLDWGKSGGTSPIDTINAANGIICTFHGHIHNFKVNTVTGTEIARMAIPNAGYSRENQYGVSYNIDWGESFTYSKTANSAEDTSFCVVTIDLAAKKIYADHYGAGYDRVIGYDDTVVETYSVTNTLTNVTSSNAAATVTEEVAYSATLTAPDGYVIEAVTVTMGGSDITATAYANGKITIGSVTGNIVITATAVEQPQVGYTNLVSTLEATDSTQPYNGIGYKNGCYASGSGEGTDAECVLTGLLPYDYAGGVRTPIYIKGCTLDTSKSHVRIICFRSAKTACFQSASGSSISTYFNVETLGTNYYKVTPLEAISSQSGEVKYLRLSLVGTGENLIITHSQPIE